MRVLHTDVQDHAHRYNVTPIITFDQPLWWKALRILVTEPVTSQMKQMVLRLGGFHTEMSFLGCIGHLMASSGLQELLEMIYASNTVVHMLTGKAIARAVRGHFIIDAALNALVLSGKYHILSALSEDTDDIVDPTSVDEDYKANYTKSALIYLQRMSHLQEDHPEVYRFQNGLHVIRRKHKLGKHEIGRILKQFCFFYRRVILLLPTQACGLLKLFLQDNNYK